MRLPVCLQPATNIPTLFSDPTHHKDRKIITF